LLGGKQLFDWANQRKEPIPVFAEMSKHQSVFYYPKIKQSAADVAKLYAVIYYIRRWQFCTNPGLIVVSGGRRTAKFHSALPKK